VVLLDAYALIALFGHEPVASEVQQLIDRQEAGMTAANLAEVIDVMNRIYEVPSDEVDLALDALFPHEMTLIPLGETTARAAGSLRAAYYGRRGKPLSLADCFLLAAAGPGDSVATADAHVAEVARLEQIEVVPLPDRAGHRP
jgi:predicted nucleic acid-binding protein